MQCDMQSANVCFAKLCHIDFRLESYVLSFSYTYSRIDMVYGVGESEMATINLHSNNNDVISMKWL